MGQNLTKFLLMTDKEHPLIYKAPDGPTTPPKTIVVKYYPSNEEEIKEYMSIIASEFVLEKQEENRMYFNLYKDGKHVFSYDWHKDDRGNWSVCMYNPETFVHLKKGKINE
jgi:hypothetical protein